MTKMPTLITYQWYGKNQQGTLLSGEFTAPNSAAVKLHLRQQGILLLKIRKKTFSLWASRRIRTTDITVFSRQLATLLVAGISFVQALELIGRSHNKPALQLLITSIKNRIEGGSGVAETLRRHPKYFNELYCNLVAIGEKTGTLDIMLERLAAYKEKSDSLKGKIKKALFYPTAIITVALLVIIAMLLFVIPQFETLFAGFGASLPWPTRLLIAIAHFFQSKGWLIIGLLFISGVGIKWLLRHKDGWLLKLFLIGPLLRKAVLARFARTLAVAYTAGIPLLDALITVAGATGNCVYVAAVGVIGQQVANGRTLQQAMQHTDLFPPLLVQLVAVGEETGTLDRMLSKVADIYEEEVDNRVASFSSLLEPIIMVVLGVLIGGLVLAMYLPIFKLGSLV